MEILNEYGSLQFEAVETGDDCKIYQMKNESGSGTLTSYDVFPGVNLSYNDFHMRYFESEFVPKRNFFCIDHCREGRLEYEARDEAYSYVGAGDLKIDRRLNHTGRFEMPLSHYHGLMISFDLDVASDTLPHEVKDFPVNLAELQNKFCPDKNPFVIHALPSVEHICAELYAVPREIRKPYFKIKVLELLLFLQALQLPKISDERPYFYKSQVEKVKEIAQHLSDNIEKNYTQESLAEQFGISRTAMKECFSSVYGMPIGAWLTEYRMNRATELLKQSPDMSIIEVAGCVGYESPSKFAIAFRRVIGMSPTEYKGTV